jgi:hypothetical protein
VLLDFDEVEDTSVAVVVGRGVEWLDVVEDVVNLEVSDALAVTVTGTVTNETETD